MQSENPTTLLVLIAVIAVIMMIFGIILVLVVRRQIEDSLHHSQREQYEAMSRKSEETFNRVLERERHTDLREREIIVDLRSIIEEFRQILDVLSALQPEGWEENRIPLEQRLNRVDAKLDQKVAALTAA